MNQTVPVRVLNLKDCEIKLSEGTFLGKIEEVDVDQKFNNAEEVFPPAETKHLQNSVGVDICVPLHLQDLFSESSNGLTNPQRQRLCMLLKKFPDIFAKDDYDLDTFSGVKHRIHTVEAKPIRQPARRTPLGFQGEEDAHLQKLMETGVVKFRVGITSSVSSEKRRWSAMRRFVRGYAEIALPLHDLTKKDAKFEWGDRQTEAFEALKKSITASPVLAYPLDNCRFVLDTDASNRSIGAVLSQIKNGEEKVVAYASRRLTLAQEKYCVTRRKLLSVVAFCTHFKHYILGHRLSLRTDHSSLSWLFRFKSPQGQLARWLEVISQYSFDIEHRAGKMHVNADALSRIPDDVSCPCYFAGATIGTLPCGGCMFCANLQTAWERFEEDVDDVVPIAVRSTKVPVKDCMKESENDNIKCDVSECNWLQTKSPKELHEEQMQDEDLKTLHAIVCNGETMAEEEAQASSPALRKYLLTLPQLKLVQDVLYYQWEYAGQESVRILIPFQLRKEVIQACHGAIFSGHQGEKRTLERVKKSFHWHSMSTDVAIFVRKCHACASEKKNTKTMRASL
ncbi:uncharacterized protein LOC132544373 [Ylistrum balloti]|uniref:uncharacterized protein LOC132544373 n=1 Tax=Ylistrum balloti TaxID=509963 RepID=UPI0029059B02|nr:uncharacterized protein LOC132544373 [Ylistrum balloti]